MSLVSLGQPFLFPSRVSWSTVGQFNSGNIQAGASGQKIGAVIRVPKSGTLDKFEFLVPLYTGTNTVQVAFQDVGLADGLPDGVNDQFRAGNPPNGAWFAPGLITSDGTDGGSKRVVTAGDYLACIAEFSAYTSGALQMRTYTGPNGSGPFYNVTHNGTSWSKGLLNVYPGIVLKYDDGSYMAPLSDVLVAFSSITANATFNSGSTPDEVAMRLRMPFRCTVVGAAVNLDDDEDITIRLYNDADTVLASATNDKDVRGVGAADELVFYTFTAPVTLETGVTYRLSALPNSTTNCRYWDSTYDAAVMGASGGGTQWYLSTRTDGGSWTDTTTSRPLGWHLLVSQVDDGAGTSSFVATGGTGQRPSRIRMRQY